MFIDIPILLYFGISTQGFAIGNTPKCNLLGKM